MSHQNLPLSILSSELPENTLLGSQTSLGTTSLEMKMTGH